MKKKSSARTISRYIAYDSEKNLDFILGNECVKRAIEVANMANQTLLIIGSPETQAEEISNSLKPETVLRADRMDDRQIMSWQPCPCGFYKHPIVPCTCGAKELREHLKEKPITDMEVTMVSTKWNNIEDIISKILNQPSISLLRTAYDKLHIGYREILSIITRARAIANMDKEKEIKIEHIAEAIQYCPSNNK